eukprot:149025-Pleurochrysis_carterae.AAC.1
MSGSTLSSRSLSCLPVREASIVASPIFIREGNVVHEGDHPKEHTARKPEPRSPPPLTIPSAQGLIRRTTGEGSRQRGKTLGSANGLRAVAPPPFPLLPPLPA